MCVWAGFKCSLPSVFLFYSFEVSFNRNFFLSPAWIFSFYQAALLGVRAGVWWLCLNVNMEQWKILTRNSSIFLGFAISREMTFKDIFLFLQTLLVRTSWLIFSNYKLTTCFPKTSERVHSFNLFIEISRYCINSHYNEKECWNLNSGKCYLHNVFFLEDISLNHLKVTFWVIIFMIFLGFCSLCLAYWTCEEIVENFRLITWISLKYDSFKKSYLCST